MDVKQYKQAVIELFRSGKATAECWDEMAAAVLYVSESSGCEHIDPQIFKDAKP